MDAAEGDDCERDQDGSESHDRAGPEDPGTGSAVDGPFAKEFRNVVIGLEQRLSRPPGKDSFDAIDDAKEQRRN
jgi:hypothetical protein